jgi:hypothetical protein
VVRQARGMEGCPVLYAGGLDRQGMQDDLACKQGMQKCRHMCSQADKT